MKLGVFSINYPRYEGDPAGSFIKELADAYKKLGHDVFVLAYFDPLVEHRPNERWRSEGIYFCKYIWPKRLHLLGYSRTIHADISVSTKMYFLSVFLHVFAFLKLLFLLIKQKPDVLHVHWLLPNGFIAAFACRLLNVPYAITLHGSGVFMAERNFIFRMMANFALKKTKIVFSCSEDLKQRVEKLGSTQKNIAIIPNGVDLDEFGRVPNPEEVNSLKRRFRVEGKRVIMATGRYVFKKGFENLIKAFAQIQNDFQQSVLFLVGDGELRGMFEKLCRQCNLTVDQDVILTGEVKHNKLVHLYSMCDIFVLPSIRDQKGNVDGLPIVLLEAMAVGKPIIASRIAGIPLVVEDKKNGLLVTPGNVGELVQAIRFLLHEKEVRISMGVANRSKMLSHFGWEKSAEKMLKLMDEMKTTPSPKT